MYECVVAFVCVCMFIRVFMPVSVYACVSVSVSATVCCLVPSLLPLTRWPRTHETHLFGGEAIAWAVHKQLVQQAQGIRVGRSLGAQHRH